MPIHVESIPPDHLSTQSGIRFDTYRFYLGCVSEYLVATYGDLASFIDHIHSVTSSIGRLPSLEPAEIERVLRIAWNTEFLLYIDLGDPEIIRINNQWAPIQAYYTVYSGMEALAYAINGDHSGMHQKTLRKCSDYLINLGVSPWDKAFKGPRGRSGSDHRPMNFPAGTKPPHNLQRAGVNPLEMIATCLRAQHSHRIDEKWKSRKDSGCFKYQYDPRPTTLLHFLYRLRLKSNYEEIDTFVTTAPEHHVLEFAQSLRALATWSLALFETILIRRFGHAPIIRQANGYLTTNPNASVLSGRMSHYKESFE